MEKQPLIGDLVIPKKNSSSKNRFPNIPNSDLGLGVVVEKVTELLVFPHDHNVYQYDSEDEMMLEKTHICKVFWFNLERFSWEFENQLEILSYVTLLTLQTSSSMVS